MRAKWIFAGVLGAPVITLASPNATFYTVLNQGEVLNGDSYWLPEEVVVGAGGVVATIAFGTSGNQIVTYSTPIAGNQWVSQIVFEENTPETVLVQDSPQVQEYFEPTSLSLAGNPLDPSGATRLMFEATSASNSDDSGILQWDANSPSYLSDVAFAGDGQGYSNITLFATNASGQALFAAQDSSDNTVLLRGDGSGLSELYSSASSSLTLVDPTQHFELAGNNSAAVEFDSGGSDGVYNVPANGGTPTEVSGSLIPVHATTDGDYHGEPILGYTNGNGLNATLMLTTNSDSSMEDIDLSKNGGAPVPILSAPFATDYPYPADGQMSVDGKVALYVPGDNGPGDTIQYADAAAANPMAKVIASVAPSSGSTPATAIALNPGGPSNYYITALNGLSLLWEPEVNDSGTVAFLADIGSIPNDPNAVTALLDWQPGDVSPTELLAVGDQIFNDTATVSSISLNSQFLPEQDDIYSDTLSDGGYLAVNINYYYDDDPNQTNYSAILMTQIAVPEPASAVMISVFGLALLSRRRRRV